MRPKSASGALHGEIVIDCNPDQTWRLHGTMFAEMALSSALSRAHQTEKAPPVE
jgi:hypothetical protein